MFRNREDAAVQLAEHLKGRPLRDPLVLAIPRGGVVTGAALARELGAELDVVLSRKLRAPGQPELAIGAVSETGEVYLNHHADEIAGSFDDYFALEKQRQMKEIARRNRILREVRPQAAIEGRSVIVTDDGIATGSTMIAALKEIRLHKPHGRRAGVTDSREDLERRRNLFADSRTLLGRGSILRGIQARRGRAGRGASPGVQTGGGRTF